jgi:hypothetical protein
MSISPVMITTTAMTVAITTLAMASPEAMTTAITATAIMSRRAIIPQPKPRFMSQPRIMITMPSISMTTD